jgi:hypothetical protein
MIYLVHSVSDRGAAHQSIRLNLAPLAARAEVRNGLFVWVRKKENTGKQSTALRNNKTKEQYIGYEQLATYVFTVNTV